MTVDFNKLIKNKYMEKSLEINRIDTGQIIF